jgi:leucyl-tRNA synthetase
MFGKNFEKYQPEVTSGVEEAAKEKTDLTKFSAKKTKAVMKSGGKKKYQFEVMLSMGIPKENIHIFAEPRNWLETFSGLWKSHLDAFGCSIDWRRSFITTDENPYYDSFVKWQVNRLKELGKIQYGSRYTVYSPLDQQACMDHDRSSGEGVLVQEYTAIKCRVKQLSKAATEALGQKLPADAHSKIFLVPATLRPETMYGQTNVFVSPTIVYGIYKTPKADEYFLITDRAARNMAYQQILEWGKPEKVVEIPGAALVGTLVDAPLSFRKEGVYVVPMDTIKDSKGTGVVTSVPSDSPDDWVMTAELNKKTDYYKIEKQWVSLDVLPIIETPKGNLIAKTIANEKKINSPKDAKQLAEAKEEAYKVGFYQGKMIYGEFSGTSVQEAKPKVRQALIDAGLAFPYSEPDGLVISRSGDTCVAALLPQWFLTYGEGDPDWRAAVLTHITSNKFNSYAPETMHAIKGTLGWLNQWSLTRNFGLGTRPQWDDSQLVESLSDSTIYMAYYTIVTYLHKDIYGRELGDAKILPESMTAAVWDYVFALSPAENPPESKIPKATLQAMRRSFTYWYPVDIRISGKDLINNHLIMFLYIHQAVWGTHEESKYLPRGIRMNGHVMLNGEKMSKSTGTFLTLDEAVRKFGADSVRIMLADAGDSGAEDANADETVANSVILKLFELKTFVEEVIRDCRVLQPHENFAAVKDKESIRKVDGILRAGAKSFWDEIFENELHTIALEAVQQYQATQYKAALKAALFDLIGARDAYRVATHSAHLGMHQASIRAYVEYQAILLAPIAPHWADYVWQEVLKKESTVCLAPFPSIPKPRADLTATNAYVKATLSSIGSAEGNAIKKRSKGKATTFDPRADKKLIIFVAKTWPKWQDNLVELVRKSFDAVSLKVDQAAVGKGIAPADKKKAMPFVAMMKRRLEGGEAPADVFDRGLPFDEVKVLLELVPGLKTTMMKLREVQVVVVEDGKARVEGGEALKEVPVAAEGAEPGRPAFEFSNLA